MSPDQVSQAERVTSQEPVEVDHESSRQRRTFELYDDRNERSVGLSSHSMAGDTVGAGVVLEPNRPS